MNILVVNDDGIRSVGLRALVDALNQVGDVYVCAPENQRSGFSQAITIGRGLRVFPVEYPGAKGAYITSGTPADCTKAGLQFFAKDGVKMDIVYSGINLGSNLGMDTLYSGTVGAAIEAAMDGIHAVAVSADSHEATHFETACQLAVDVIPYVMEKITANTILNINVPDLPPEEIKGLRYTRLGARFYDDSYVLQENGAYRLTGEPDKIEEEHPDSDVRASMDGYATITPLQFDYTQFEKIKEVSDWGLTIRK